MWLVCAGALCGAALIQNVVYAGLHYPNHANPNSYDEAYDWLRRETPQDAVVVTLDPEVDCEIGAFTRAKVLVANGDPVFSDISETENLKRLHQAVGLYGKSWEAYLDGSAEVEGEYQNAGYFLGPFLGTVGRRKVLESSASRVTKGDYAADYVWVGPFERKLFGAGRIPIERGEPVFHNRDISIYKAGAP